jgi:hypothetical protein
MNDHPIELRFHIYAFTKATMPMRRLAEYMLDLGVILGEDHAVHLDRIEDGSAVPVFRLDAESEPKVIRNAQRAKSDQAPKQVREAKVRMEQRLAADNAKGADLVDQARGFKLIHFKGRDTIQPPWGPIRQAAELSGVVIGIGGKTELVTIRLQDGERVHTCHAKRSVARELRQYLLEDKPVRVHGYGKWTRDDQGLWGMDDFTIAGFDVLDPAPMAEVLERLRSVKSEWLDGPDPIKELQRNSDDS